MKKTTATLLAAIVGLAGAFGVPIDANAQTSTGDLKKVTLRLGFIYNAHRSPYLLGKDKGFYKEEGLDVEVLEGRGFTSTMQLVASKQDTFAVVDPPSLMLGVAQGMPLKMVAQLYQKSPNALVSWASANISEPKDLVGKTVATLQGDTTTTMLYALLARNNIKAADVKIFAADGGTRNQTFLGKRSEAITGFTNDSYLSLGHTAGETLKFFRYSDYGINTMGDGIITHADTIKASPDLVRAFVKASVRAYKHAVDNPGESVDSLEKVTKVVSRDVELEKIKATKPLLSSADTDKFGVGYSSKAEWESAQALMLEFGGLTKKAANVEEYYSNDFVPAK